MIVERFVDLSAVLFAHLNCFYRQSRYRFSLWKQKSCTRVILTNESVQPVNIPVLHRNPPVQWFSPLLHGAFCPCYDQRACKKEVQVSLSLYGQISLSVQRWKLKKKVIKSQILNFVHVLHNRIPPATQLHFILSPRKLLPPYAFIGMGQGTGFQIKIHTHCCYSD